MSWSAILLLASASYALKAVGPMVVGAREIGAPVRALLDLAPVPLLAALILTQTVSAGGGFVFDARVPALGVAAILTWRRAPFLVIVLAAAATAALLRAV